MKRARSFAVVSRRNSLPGPVGRPPARAAWALVSLFSLAMLTVFANGCSSCKKDDDDAKPAPTASTPPAPLPPSASVTVAPEEPAAPANPIDAGVDAGRRVVGPGGPGLGSGTLAKCCDAIQQNANSAPLDQKAYYMAAATYCNGMRNTPAGQQAFAQIRAFLQGAKLPGACK